MDFSQKVTIFDPIVPTQKVEAQDSSIDTWHDKILITRALRERLPLLKEGAKQRFYLPGGMYIFLPSIEIGLIVGNISIRNVDALVADEGRHDIIIGSEALRKLFTVGAPSAPSADIYEPSSAKQVEIISPWKNDSEALSLEVYPLSGKTVAVRHFEQFLLNLRVLYNISYVCTKLSDSLISDSQIVNIINQDRDIPISHQLQISYVENGSIRVNLKSSCKQALNSISKIFIKGHDIALKEASQPAVPVTKSDSKAVAVSIRPLTAESRSSIATQQAEEEARLNTDRISDTYDKWRQETRENLRFFDDLIMQASKTDQKTALILTHMKNKAIIEIAEQQLLPILRNIPQSDSSSDPVSRGLLLPPLPPVGPDEE